MLATHDWQPGASDARRAVAEIESAARLQAVGVTELFHESVCLLLFRLRQWVPAMCDCANATAQSQRSHIRFTHGVPHMDVERLDGTDVEQIDAITRGDRRVHDAGVVRLVADLREVESQTGRQILCDATTRRLALAYPHLRLAPMLAP